MSDSEVDSNPFEPLPSYDQNQLPQSPFDAVLTRIAISTRDPDARVTLERFIESQKAPAYSGSQQAEAPKPIEEYPIGTELLTRVKQQTVMELFCAIRREDSESISLLIQNNLVTANTRNEAGLTPLLEAISTKITHLVKELLDFGADPNAFAVVDQATRTPLMLAASTGSLPIVKLLFEPPYSANDALIAPDGQIALRLASAADHRIIVEYLPSRRAGGFLRWKTQNALAIARMKAALRQIGSFIKFFILDLPKFFFWSVPKHLVVLPVVRCCKWCWANRKKFGDWCKHHITEMPKRVVRAGKRVWKGVKKIPKAIKKTGKELWKFGTQTLPRWIKKLALWFWNLITVRIPKAIGVVAKWIWHLFTVRIPKAIGVVAKWIWHLITVRIHKAIGVVAKWIWRLITVRIPKAIGFVAKWIWRSITVRIPKAIGVVAKWIWRFITIRIPKAIGVVAKWIWDLIAVRIPKAIGVVAKWIWHLITVRISRAVVAVAKWIWAGISSLSRAAWDVILKIVSLLHTVLLAIVTFLRNLTLRDIWNGFCDVLRAILITFPTTLWSWIQRFGVVSFEVMTSLFGWFGEWLWWTAVGLKRLVFYIPSKLWIVLQSLGDSIARGWAELMVWIYPKL